MWSRSVASAAILQAVILCGLADASAATGEEVLQSCEAVLRSATKVTRDSTWVPNEGRLCWHYIEAIWDASMLVEPDKCQTLPCKYPTLGICFADVTFTQIIRIFVKAAQDNPKLLNQNAAGVVIAAFRNAFPCK